MAKIPNDKYYTPQHIVDKCVNKVKEIVADDVTEIIEPSAGNGAFIESLDNNFNCDKYYFDLIPEHDKIKQQDFLEFDLEYKQGRVIVGNPPFGNRSTLIVKFFKKSVRLGDYIAFILPISQLNNVKQLYEFDLIHSEDLGKQNYSGVDLHCCFNIYKSPSNGVLNSKPKLIKIDGLEVIEYRRGIINLTECLMATFTLFVHGVVHLVKIINALVTLLKKYISTQMIKIYNI